MMPRPKARGVARRHDSSLVRDRLRSCAGWILASLWSGNYFLASILEPFHQQMIIISALSTVSFVIIATGEVVRLIRHLR